MFLGKLNDAGYIIKQCLMKLSTQKKFFGEMK